MTGVTASRLPAHSGPNSTRLDQEIPLFGGGIVIGGVAIVVCSLVNAIAIALYDFLAGSDPQRWPSAVVIGFGVFAVLVSAVVGRSLFQLRRMIARRDRRSFTSGAMSMYLLLTPIVWVMVVAIANSAT